MVTRVSIGSRRITSGTRGSVAGATRDIRAQFKGIETRLRETISNIKDATPDAVRHGLQPIFDKSQEYVPVDTMELKNSGYLEVRESSHKVEAEIGYARGGHPHYAVIVHEDPDLQHKSPTRSKFLEQAINEKFSGVKSRILSALRSALNG